MTKKIISMVISLLVLVSCFAMPIGTVQAETVAKDFTFSANFDNLDDLAAGEIDETVFAEKTGLTITQSGLSSVSDGVLNLYGSTADPVTDYYPTLAYTLPETVTTGTLTASIKIPAKVLDAATEKGLAGYNVKFFPYKVQGQVFRYSNGVWQGMNDAGGEWNIGVVSPDAEGNYNFRAVYSRENETDYWKLSVYNDSLATPALIGKERTSLTTDAISAFTLIALTPISGGVELGGDSSVLIDDVNITYDNGVLDEATSFNFNANFDGLADGKIDATTFTKNTGLEITSPSLSSIAGGALKLYGTNTTGTVKPDLIYTLPGYVNKGTLEASVKIPAESAEAAGIAGYNVRFFQGIMANWAFRYSNGKFMATNDAVGEYQIYPTRDTEDGSYNFRAVFTRENETDNWAITLYDDSTAEPTQLLARTSTTTDAITSLKFIHLEPLSGVTGELNGDASVLIDDVNVSYDDGTTPVPTPEPTPVPTVKDFTFNANFDNLADGAINEETFAESTGLTITQSGGSTISGGVLNLYGSHSIGNRKPDLIYNLPGTITKGTITASLKVPAKIVEGETVKGIEGFNVRFFPGIMLNWAFRYSNGRFLATNDAGGEYQIYPTRNTEDGSYNFRAVFTRENETDKWAITLYDDSTAEPTQLLARTSAETDYITSLKLIHLEPTPATGELNGDVSVLIDDVNVTYDNGILDEAESFAFKANFDSLADGAVNAETFTNDTGLTITSPSLSSITGGALKLYGTNTTGTVYPDLSYTLPGYVSKGTLEASIKIPAESAEAAGIAGYNVRFFVGLVKNWAFRYSNGNWQATNNDGNEFPITVTKGEDGTYTFRAVYTRENETDNWSVTIYNDSLAEPAQLIARTSTTTDAITSLKLIQLMPISGVTGQLNGDASVLLDDIKVVYDDGITPPPADDDEEDEDEVKENNIVFDFESLYLFDDNGVVESLAGLTEITAEIDAVNKKGTNESFQLVLAAYDADGRLLAINASGSYTPGTATDVYDVTLEGFEDAAEIKLFFVSDISEMRPLEDVLRVTEVLSPVGF